MLVALVLGSVFTSPPCRHVFVLLPFCLAVVGSLALVVLLTLRPFRLDLCFDCCLRSYLDEGSSGDDEQIDVAFRAACLCLALESSIFPEIKMRHLEPPVAVQTLQLQPACCFASLRLRRVLA